MSKRIGKRTGHLFNPKFYCQKSLQTSVENSRIFKQNFSCSQKHENTAF